MPNLSKIKKVFSRKIAMIEIVDSILYKLNLDRESFNGVSESLYSRFFINFVG